MQQTCMRRWKCVCTYDGSAFCGWQSQTNGRGVQDILEGRLAKIFKQFIRVHGSSRTDAGVHARGQVFHFDAEWCHSTDDLLSAINSGLGYCLHVNSVEPVDQTFHARFSAVGKRYCYYLLLRQATPFEWRYCWPLMHGDFDLDAVLKAAPLFEGSHLFNAFAGKVLNGENPRKFLSKVSIVPQDNAYLRIETLGSGYLYRMVRKIVGALVGVAYGKLSMADIEYMLLSGEKKKNVMTAPAQGLFLQEVLFDASKFSELSVHQ